MDFGNEPVASEDSIASQDISANAPTEAMEDTEKSADQTSRSGASVDTSPGESTGTEEIVKSDVAADTKAANESSSKSDTAKYMAEADSKTFANSSHLHRLCSTSNAMTQPLTEEGFRNISESCCNVEMNLYVKRVVKEMKLKVCDQGALSGMVPFYLCPQTPKTLYDMMKELLSASPLTSLNVSQSEAKDEAGKEPKWLVGSEEECPEGETKASAEYPR